MVTLIKFLVAGTVMVLLDYLWLGFVAKNFYRREMGTLLLEHFQVLPAIIFYGIYTLGLVVFVINPAIDKSSWQHATAYGALFGLIAYATYDLTNLAVAKDFSTKVAIVDIAWGALISAAVASVTTVIVLKWFQ